MSVSIRVRTIVVLNVYVVGLALVMGWIAQDTAGRLVEERYVKEMVASASGFLAERPYPRTDAMMGYLRELFNAEWVAAEGDGGVVASSLPDDATQQFNDRMPALADSGTVHLHGRRYRFDSAKVAGPPPDAEQEVGRLFMLVPDEQFAEARRRAQARVAWVIIPAAATATVLAILFSFSVTRPVRRLGAEMDRLSDAQGAVPARDAAARRGPKDIRRLAGSFDRLLERLADARRQMVHSEQLAALGKVSLSVAHELRNPLSGIKMNVRVLQDREGLADDPAMAAVLREIERMELYLDELMGLAPGDRPAATAPVRLSELAESVLLILAGKLRHASINVTKDFPADEPAVVVDGDRIRQAMMNLLVNAVEASPPGGKVVVSVRRVEDRVRFSVTDAGKGVDLGEDDVFAAFATGKPNGVGLGLYICRQIVARHGGEIGYDSSDAGATFWFEAPIEPPAERRPIEQDA